MSCLVSSDNYTTLFDNNYKLMLNVSFIGSCWPGVTYENLLQLINLRLLTSNPVAIITVYCTFILTPMGVIGNILCAIGFWRKAIKEKERFYMWMLATAILDFLFCVITICFKVPTSFPAVTYLYRHTFAAAWAYRVLYGIYRALVITSDLCALALAFERALAVTRPTKQLTKRQMNVVTVVEIFLFLVLSFVRFYRYTFEQVVVYNPSSGYYGNTLAPVRNTDWFQALTIFSDFILVVIILGFMILCSTVIAIAVLKRRQSRIQDSASSQQQQQVQQQSFAMLRLLTVVLLLYMASQVAYFSYEVAQFMGRKFDDVVRPVMSYEEVRTRLYISFFWDTASACSVILSIFSRAVNFLFYYICSPTFRQEFKKAIGRSDISVVTVGSAAGSRQKQ